MKQPAARKASFSLSPRGRATLIMVAERFTNRNESLVVDTAIKLLASLKPAEIERLVSREIAERGAVTRDVWMRTFWSWLARHFDATDIFDNPYAPRSWGGFTTVFLLKSMTEVPTEKDPFFVHAFPDAANPVADRFDRTYSRDHSPIEAADELAQFIRSRARSGMPA